MAVYDLFNMIPGKMEPRRHTEGCASEIQQARVTMAKFSKRYMDREEHQKIIEYYRRIVGNLQCEIVALRVQSLTNPMESIIEHGRRVAERELRQSFNAGGNVVTGNFRSRVDSP